MSGEVRQSLWEFFRIEKVERNVLWILSHNLVERAWLKQPRSYVCSTKLFPTQNGSFRLLWYEILL